MYVLVSPLPARAQESVAKRVLEVLPRYTCTDWDRSHAQAGLLVHDGHFGSRAEERGAVYGGFCARRTGSMRAGESGGFSIGGAFVHIWVFGFVVLFGATSTIAILQ